MLILDRCSGIIAEVAGGLAVSEGGDICNGA